MPAPPAGRECLPTSDERAFCTYRRLERLEDGTDLRGGRPCSVGEMEAVGMARMVGGDNRCWYECEDVGGGDVGDGDVGDGDVVGRVDAGKGRGYGVASSVMGPVVVVGACLVLLRLLGGLVRVVDVL